MSFFIWKFAIMINLSCFYSHTVFGLQNVDFIKQHKTSHTYLIHNTTTEINLFGLLLFKPIFKNNNSSTEPIHIGLTAIKALGWSPKYI